MATKEARDCDVELRCRPAREPRRDRVLRALRGARRSPATTPSSRRTTIVEPFVARRRPAHGRDRRRLGRARRHVAAVLRGQAVRGGARARRHPELVRRVPPTAHRRVRRVRAQARTGRAHRGERRQPRAQAVPQPLGRRHRASSRIELQLLLRGEVVWRKGEGAAGNCAWGSFRSAANPVLRDTTERVVIASKGRFDRAHEPRPSASAAGSRRRTRSTPTSSWTPRSTCGTSSPRARAASSHPAPFPVELPERLIDLYTYENDLVLDPFMGSGSTLVAAARRGRRYVGYDLDPTYVDIARLRVRDEGTVAPAGAARASRRADSASVDDADELPGARDQGRQGRAGARRGAARRTPASRSSPRTSGCAAPA